MKSIKNLVLILIAIVAIPQSIFAKWEKPETGTEGAITSIVSLDNKLYAGSTTNGVYISANNGSQWIEWKTGLPTNGLNVQSLVVCANSVYAGTNGGGIYKLNTSKNKWEPMNEGLGNLYIYSLAAEGDNIYAVTDESGVYMSSDRGKTWRSINNGDIIGILLFTVSVKNGTVYAGGQYGDVYTTSDKGVTWNNIKSGDLFYNVKSIAFNNEMILVGTASGVVLSENKGKTWKMVNSGIKNTDITYVGFNGKYLYAASKGGGICISNNNGESWITINEGLPDLNVNTFAFNSEYIFAGTQYNSIARRKLSEIIIPEVKPPLLVLPENDNPAVSPEVLFSWKESQGSKFYFIQVALSENFDNPIFRKDTIKTTTIKQKLEKGRKYYWRVAAIDDKNERKWSEVWSFTTRDDLTRSKLIKPANKANGVAIPVSFVWSKSKGVSYYKVQISKDKKFEELLVNRKIDNDTTFVYKKFEIGKKYYWYVVSVGFDNSKMISDTFSFTTGTASVFEYANNNNGYVSLYPNPVNTHITLQINFKATNADIAIISTAGTVLANVYDGILTNGFELHLDKYIKSLPSALYYIRINSKERRLIVPFIKN